MYNVGDEVPGIAGRIVAFKYAIKVLEDLKK
jgi:hypothetical protein